MRRTHALNLLTIYSAGFAHGWRVELSLWIQPSTVCAASKTYIDAIPRHPYVYHMGLIEEPRVVRDKHRSIDLVGRCSMRAARACNEL